MHCHPTFSAKSSTKQPSLCKSGCNRYTFSSQSMYLPALSKPQHTQPQRGLHWMHQQCPITATWATDSNSISAYPFEQICAYYFHIGAYPYLCIIDHFSGCIWIYSFRAHEVNNIKFQNIFRDLSVAYDVSEELSSDGVPQLIADSF